MTRWYVFTRCMTMRGKLWKWLKTDLGRISTQTECWTSRWYGWWRLSVKPLHECQMSSGAVIYRSHGVTSQTYVTSWFTAMTRSTLRYSLDYHSGWSPTTNRATGSNHWWEDITNCSNAILRHSPKSLFFGLAVNRRRQLKNVLSFLTHLGIQ